MRSTGKWWQPVAARPVAAAAATLLLISAGVWSWSGANSDVLDLKDALRVLSMSGSYTEENLLAAIGKVDREVVELVTDLDGNRGLTNGFKLRCLAELDGPETNLPVPTGEVLDRLRSQRVPLTAPEEKVILQVLRACGGSLRKISGYSPTCQLYASYARESIEACLQ